MTTKKLTKLLALCLPYILLGLVATNFGEAWRLSEGKELGDKIMSMMGTISVAFANPLPSLHPLDLLVGLCCGAGLSCTNPEKDCRRDCVESSYRRRSMEPLSGIGCNQQRVRECSAGSHVSGRCRRPRKIIQMISMPPMCGIFFFRG